MVLLELLKKGHEEPDKKIDKGIKGFQVRIHPVWKSKCFFVIKDDDTFDDFSFRKSVDHILPLPDEMKQPDTNKASNGSRGGKGSGRGCGKRRWAANAILYCFCFVLDCVMYCVLRMLPKIKRKLKCSIYLRLSKFLIQKCLCFSHPQHLNALLNLVFCDVIGKRNWKNFDSAKLKLLMQTWLSLKRGLSFGALKTWFLSGNWLVLHECNSLLDAGL